MAQIIVDVVLVVLILARALTGFNRGLMVRLPGLLGFAGGALLGVWFGPGMVAKIPWVPSSREVSTLAIIILVIGFAVIAEALVTAVMQRLVHDRGERAGWLDGLLGLALSVVVSSLMLWFAGAAVRPLLPTPWAQTVNQSRVLTTIDRFVPKSWSWLPSQATEILSETGLPRVFSGLLPEPVIPAPAPDVGVRQSPGVKAAEASVVQVLSDAPRCTTDSAGSGWVVAPQRVVTNAHVVAGSSQVEIRVGGTGPMLPATVVGFDSQVDVAVLAVPELRAKPLRQADALPDKTDVVAAGFPEGGPYTVSAARVRGTINAVGEDIYRSGTVTREVYSLRGVVRPGNSGGPLLTADGRVAGTVFARSLVDADTGYALTNTTTAPVVSRAAQLTQPVSTGACSVG